MQSVSAVQGAKLSVHSLVVQNTPLAAVLLEAPVVSGVRVTGSGAWYAPPPRSGGQSWLVPLLLVVTHAPFAFAPYVHAPLTQCGHGDPRLPVT